MSVLMEQYWSKVKGSSFTGKAPLYTMALPGTVVLDAKPSWLSVAGAWKVAAGGEARVGLHRISKG